MTRDADPRPSATLTREMLEQMYVEIRDSQRVPCGSEERPHVVHPKAPHICINCGAVQEERRGS